MKVKYGYKDVPNPLLKVMKEESKTISSFSEQLCISLLDRTRMGVVKAESDEENPMSKFAGKQNV